MGSGWEYILIFRWGSWSFQADIGTLTPKPRITCRAAWRSKHIMEGCFARVAEIGLLSQGASLLSHAPAHPKLRETFAVRALPLWGKAKAGKPAISVLCCTLHPKARTCAWTHAHIMSGITQTDKTHQQGNAHTHTHTHRDRLMNRCTGVRKLVTWLFTQLFGCLSI